MVEIPDTAEGITEYLRGIGIQPDDAIDVGGAALALAALDRPGTLLDFYREHLRGLADTLRRTMPGNSLAACAHALGEVMGDHFGYRGDEQTYDDPDNASLIRVIDRRRGLPVALGILYLHAARAQGWLIDGLAFPGHFLLRLEIGGERAVIDPFHGGRTLAVAEMRDLLRRMGVNRELRAEDYAIAGNRSILLRLQNNIKQRALAANDPGRAAAVLGSMLLLAPLHAGAWRDLGTTLAQIGSLNDAARATERAAELSQDAGERHAALAFLQQLRQRLN